MIALIDRGEYVDRTTGRVVFSYAHPLFLAPFGLLGARGPAAWR